MVVASAAVGSGAADWAVVDLLVAVSAAAVWVAADSAVPVSPVAGFVARVLGHRGSVSAGALAVAVSSAAEASMAGAA